MRKTGFSLSALVLALVMVMYSNCGQSGDPVSKVSVTDVSFNKTLLVQSQPDKLVLEKINGSDIQLSFMLSQELFDELNAQERVIFQVERKLEGSLSSHSFGTGWVFTPGETGQDTVFSFVDEGLEEGVYSYGLNIRVLNKELAQWYWVKFDPQSISNAKVPCFKPFLDVVADGSGVHMVNDLSCVDSIDGMSVRASKGSQEIFFFAYGNANIGLLGLEVWRTGMIPFTGDGKYTYEFNASVYYEGKSYNLTKTETIIVQDAHPLDPDNLPQHGFSIKLSNDGSRVTLISDFVQSDFKELHYLTKLNATIHKNGSPIDLPNTAKDDVSFFSKHETTVWAISAALAGPGNYIFESIATYEDFDGQEYKVKKTYAYELTALQANSNVVLNDVYNLQLPFDYDINKSLRSNGAFDFEIKDPTGAFVITQNGSAPLKASSQNCQSFLKKDGDQNNEDKYEVVISKPSLGQWLCFGYTLGNGGPLDSSGIVIIGDDDQAQRFLTLTFSSDTWDGRRVEKFFQSTRVNIWNEWLSTTVVFQNGYNGYRMEVPLEYSLDFLNAPNDGGSPFRVFLETNTEKQISLEHAISYIDVQDLSLFTRYNTIETVEKVKVFDNGSALWFLHDSDTSRGLIMVEEESGFKTILTAVVPPLFLDDVRSMLHSISPVI